MDRFRQKDEGRDTLDHLGAEGLRIFQAQQGYRFSLDPFLLCSFADISGMTRIVDLGSGNGVIPLLLANRNSLVRLFALERQAAMAARAQRSIALNGLQDRIDVLQGDVRDLPAILPRQSFDAVFMNPPYRSPFSGRVAPDDERAAARHELAGDINDFLKAAQVLLRSGGRVFVVFLAERLAELLEALRAAGLEPKRLRMVHPRQGQSANLVLVEGRKNGRPGLVVASPLLVYKGEGRDYTDEVLEMYQ